MEYRNLGHSGLFVSEVSLGSWINASDNKQGFKAVIKTAFDEGINLFDTAEIYHAGQAETMLGEALSDYPRGDLVIATKCTGQGSRDKHNIGLNRKHMTEACEASIKRLGVDYIDLYQFHWPDNNTPIEESVETIGILLRQGKILYWGLSNYDADQTREILEVAAMLNVPAPISHQPKYNPFYRDIEERLMPLCGEAGLGFITYSPLNQGLFTGKYSDGIPAGSRLAEYDDAKQSLMLADYNMKAINKLQAVADSSDLTLVQLALAWSLRNKELSSTIIGATRPEHVTSATAASGIVLDESILKDIENVIDERWATIKINDYNEVIKNIDK
ncbi:MAG: aldo/keto reductase [Kiritimatiellae bacterium]|nr:aldo/keto reductase [Kiritimatiellia bacterium]